MNPDSPILSEKTKSRLIDMAWLLNDLTSDLKTPVDLLFNLKPSMDVSKQNFMAISRLCITSLIVNLCKLDEIISHYGFEIKDFPEEIKTSLRTVKLEIENRGMYAFRSKYVAHAFSEEKGEVKRPLNFDENVKSMMKIIDYGIDPVTDNVFRFGEWVYIKDDQSSIVYIIYNSVKYIESLVGGLGKRR